MQRGGAIFVASLKNPRVGFENVLLAIARPFLPIYLYEDLTRFFCIRFGAKSDVLFLLIVLPA